MLSFAITGRLKPHPGIEMFRAAVKQLKLNGDLSVQTVMG
jgi:hypothetical protein